MSDPWNVVEEQVHVTTRRFVLGCLLVMCLAGPMIYAGIQYAIGQGSTSGTVRTPEEWTNTQGFWGLTLAGSVATISVAGDVTIDWPVAEAMRAREYVGYDPTTVAVVRLMFAVRDGTWKAREPK